MICNENEFLPGKISPLPGIPLCFLEREKQAIFPPENSTFNNASPEPVPKNRDQKTSVFRYLSYFCYK